MPWTFKILYGLIADNFPIFDSKRKSYVILNGFMMSIVLMVLSLNYTQNELVITALLFIQSLNSAFTDVVVDALMVT